MWSNEVSEDMSARFESRGIVGEGRTVSTEREKTFRNDLNKYQEDSLVYCPDIGAFMNKIKHDYWWMKMVYRFLKTESQGYRL